MALGGQLVSGELLWIGGTDEAGLNPDSEIVVLRIVVECMKLISVRQSRLRGPQPRTGNDMGAYTAI